MRHIGPTVRSEVSRLLGGVPVVRPIGNCQAPGCAAPAVIWNDRDEEACGSHQAWLARPLLGAHLLRRMR